MLKCPSCDSASIARIGSGYFCSYCENSFDKDFSQVNCNYTIDLPSERGFYWVTRTDLGFWSIASVIDDKLTPENIWYVQLFDGRNYELGEFLDLGEQVFWSGPIKSPDENVLLKNKGS